MFQRSTTSNLHAELKTMIANLLEIADFGDTDQFIRDLRADSLLLEEVVASIEKRYSIQLSFDQLHDVRCLNDLVRVVTPRVKAIA